MTDLEFDSDDCAADSIFVGPSFIKEEMDINDYSNDSSSMEAFSNTSAHAGSSANAYLQASSKTPLIFNGKYFKIIKQIRETDHQRVASGIIAACQLCTQVKTIKGSIKITSNFLQHLKTKHHSHYKEYLLEKRNKGRASTRADVVKLSNFNEKLLRFIVDSFSSLSIVEKPSFVDLFEGTSLKVCSHKHITSLLDTKYTSLMTKLKDRLNNVPYICTTADIWTDRKKSFFCYTCHWIDLDFSRQSAALACCRFTAEHTFDKIADLIHSLNTEFGIPEEKIVCTITDNGNNFLKAFKEFGIRNDYNNFDSDEEFEFVTDLTGFSPRLPKHYRCGSHTLNLLATRDFINILKGNKRAYEKHQSSLNRCSSIWSMCNSPHTAEIIRNLLTCSLKAPTAKHWNSLYDSLKHLLHFKETLDDLCVSLNVTTFDLTELEYMEEYCSLMEPIASALNFLQKETSMYYGYFLPTLVTTKVKLHKLHEFGKLTYLKDIARQMEKALVKRFQNFFEMNQDCNDSVIAALSCPAIKMRFIKPLSETAPNISAENLQSLFLRYAKEFQEGDVLSLQSIKQEAASVPAFFDFDQSVQEIENQQISYQSDVQKEFKRYLEDDDYNLSCLDQYPTIKKVFIKYNTPLPSSAPVEMLFSFADIVNSQRRQNLTDEQFKRLVIIKANKII